MEIKQINDCQEILKIVQEAVTKEELECKKLFLNKSTVGWLSERKSDLDKKIVGLEEEITKRNIEKKEVQKNVEEKKKEQKKLLENVETKADELKKIKVTESDIKLQESLKSKISEVEKKIKEYEGEVYDIGQSKYKVDEEIKNKESNERYYEGQLSSARREVSSAETELSTSQNRYSSNTCYGGYSPELSYSCVQRYRKKVEEKKNNKEYYENTLANVRRELNGKREESKKLSETISSLNTKKNEEIAKRDQYTKEKQQVETKIQGILDQKNSLETDIKIQKAEEINVNAELLSLEKNANNFDSNALEAQKAEIFSTLYDLPKIIDFIDKYVDTYQREHQHQDL